MTKKSRSLNKGKILSLQKRSIGQRLIKVNATKINPGQYDKR